MDRYIRKVIMAFVAAIMLAGLMPGPAAYAYSYPPQTYWAQPAIAGTVGTADGIYDFGSLGGTDSGGPGFKRQGDKFVVSNIFWQDTLGEYLAYDYLTDISYYDESDFYAAGPATVVIKAEGGLVNKKFTFKDLYFDYATDGEAWLGFHQFNLTLKFADGSSVNHALAASDIDGGTAVINPPIYTFPLVAPCHGYAGYCLPLSYIFRNDAWPVNGYDNVVEIDITYRLQDPYPLASLNFRAIKVANVSASLVSDITSAGVAGMIAPVAGSAPIQYTALTRMGASYTVTGLTWQNNNGSAATLTSGGKFKAGSSYKAVVELTAAAGYKFKNGGIASPAVNTGAAGAGTVGGGDVEGNKLTYAVTFPATAALSASAIAVKTQPATLSYTEGDTLSLSGLAVTLTYNDGTPADVAYTDFAANGITASPDAGTALTVAAHNGHPVTLTCNTHTAATSNLIVAPGTPPALTAGAASRLSSTSADVTFTSSKPGAYYYSVVEDGSDAPAVNTTGAGTVLAGGENTISLTGLTSGARDIYIKAKDGAGNVSAALKMDIPAYVAPGTVLFDFGTGGDMPGESAISYQDPVSHETITLTADVPLSLHLAQDNSDDSNGILGGTDFTGMSGRTVATGTGATVTSVRITVPGPTFDLISLNFYDCFEIGYPFILMNDKGEFASFTPNMGTASNFVDLSSNSIFKGVKYVDITSDMIEFMPTLDNIVLANIAPPDLAPPAFTGISVSRPDNGYASVTFTSDEAGAFYYRAVADGAPEPTIDTNATDDSLCGLMAGVNNFTVSQLTAGAWDLYIKAKDHAGNVSPTAYKIDIPAYAAAPDTTPPTLTPGTATRQSDTSATAPFTTDEAGTLYYIVVADGAPEPTIDTSGPGAPCLEGPAAVYPGTLTADACDIYIKEKDAAGNVSAALKMDIPAYVNPDATPPTLSSGEAYRLSATTAVVIFNSDEIGDYYYQVVADGAPEPTINTSGAGTSGVAGGNNLDLTALTAGACDVYIVVKDAANNVSAALKVDIPAYVAPDMTPPVLTAGIVTRLGSYSATVTFNSNEAGAYYYRLLPAGSSEIPIDTNGLGESCVAGQNTINLTLILSEAMDIYIQVKDAAGNVSAFLKMDIPAYAAPDTTPPSLTAGTVSRPDVATTTVTFTSNEAGAYYYSIVPDGLPELPIDTNGLGTACVVGENTINLPLLPPSAWDIYIKVKDAAGNVSAALKMDIPAYTPPDMTSPTLSSGESNRLSASSATVIFTSDETGAYYYQVVSDGEAAPDIDTSGVGSSLASGGNAIPLTGLDPGALDIYIKAKDAAGNVSAALKVDIPEFFVPVTGISGVPAMAWAGTDLTLTGAVSPEDATNKTIVWTVKDAGSTGAIINGNILATANAGTAIVTATIVHGTSSALDYTHDFTITVNPAMTHQTLQDEVETATISAEGILAQDAQLIVVPIAAGDSDREEMEDLLTGKNAVAAYEVTIQPAGAFQPPLVLTFQVDEKYNGRKVFILHKLSDGSMESFTPTVADGKAVITVNALSPFLLAVDPAVMITGQPQNAIALIGQTATFHVVADGQALTYKWQRRTGASAAWKDISGATGPDYTTSVVNKSHNGYQYRAIVGDSLGNSVTSDIATLTVTVSPDTGDHSQPLVYAGLMVLFAGLILWMLLRRRTA